MALCSISTLHLFVPSVPLQRSTRAPGFMRAIARYGVLRYLLSLWISPPQLTFCPPCRLLSRTTSSLVSLRFPKIAPPVLYPLKHVLGSFGASACNI